MRGNARRHSNSRDTKEVRPILVRSFADTNAAWSPDGRGIAYESDETGPRQIYVAQYPDLSSKAPVSTAGERYPVWARNGRELFYRQGDAVMAVAINLTNGLPVERPRLLFKGAYTGTGRNASFDVSPDGTRFVMVKSDEASTLRQIAVVQNWVRTLSDAVTRIAVLPVNAVETNQAVITRFPLNDLGDRATLHGEYIKVDWWFVGPCHNTRKVGWFGVVKSDSELRVYKWDEAPTAPVAHFDFQIATIPSADFSSLTPDGDDWLPPTSNATISGAARSGNTAWFAWSAGRKYANDQPSPYAHPHIEYIGINILDFGIGQLSTAVQDSIWNPEFAFAWPSLAASPVLDGIVAISCCFGGGRRYPQHAVGILGTHKVTATTSGRSAGAGGHCNDVRLCFPKTD